MNKIFRQKPPSGRSLDSLDLDKFYPIFKTSWKKYSWKIEFPWDYVWRIACHLQLHQSLRMLEKISIGQMYQNLQSGQWHFNACGQFLLGYLYMQISEHKTNHVSKIFFNGGRIQWTLGSMVQHFDRDPGRFAGYTKWHSRLCSLQLFQKRYLIRKKKFDSL